MTLYLQRLLNRSAGAALAAGPPAAALHPALQSASPILAFDQRLGDPEVASNFGLVGASPPEALLPEPAVNLWPEPAPASRVQEGSGPLAPTPPQAPAAPLSTEAAVAVDAALETASQAPPARPRRQARRTARAVPPAPAGEEVQPSDHPAQGTAHVTPAPIVEKMVEPARPAAAPTPGKPQPEPMKSEASPAPTAVVRAEAAPEAGLAQLAERPRADAPTASPITERRGLPRQPEPATVARTAAPAAPEPAAVMARPVVAAAPPLEPAPAPFALRDIERIVEDKLRSRLANPPPAVAPPLQAAGGDAAAQAAPARKRPATAAEASLIGKLDSSAYQPMLFGVRRR